MSGLLSVVRRPLVCVAAFLLVAIASRSGGDEPKPMANGPRTTDGVQDLVALLDGPPVLVRLHLTTDGKPFRAVHQAASEAYFKALFTYLDANGDGYLSEDEAKRMPAPFKLPGDPSTRGNVNVAFNYRVVDADGDGRISRDELAAFHREFAGGAMQTQAASRTAVPAVVSERLFTILDADKDGKLSQDELRGAEAALLKLDFDGDELLTPQELAGGAPAAVVPPTPVPPGRAVATTPTLFVVSTEDDREGLASVLLARGGRGTKSLGRDALGLSREAFDRLDKDQNGSLDAAELKKFTDRPADVEIVVRLGKRDAGQAGVEVLRSDGKPATARVEGGTLTVKVGGAHVEFRVSEGRPNQPSGTHRRYLDMFRAAAGKQDHLTAKDARQRDFFPNLFPLLDRDGDGKMTERELTAYLDDIQDRQAALIAATPALLVSDRGAGLFELLDRDRDGRLSLREMREAPRLASRLGRDAADSVSRTDVLPSYRVAVGLGMASLGRGGPELLTPRGMPMLSLEWVRPGIIWFHRMDRNHDGDVSAREFLGPRETFRKIDADGDGLISLDEAEKAEAMFRK